ncbi:asparaginase [Colletotrichum graminicola]|uniref:asparaginase n=1 Tax=Colletotrichum graminicola (strain M1.001 / M2 / FGSC 10212) TaxID=645133 RepID=E3QQI5_COLGM|nr:asparaginase [Colletotrichum graminicola M1.001]EFQ33123.1 asparaginase [Colletotrichum graminicola M1.001]WDK21937.1 asparaginase [Colletotrichum graminicola]
MDSTQYMAAFYAPSPPQRPHKPLGKVAFIGTGGTISSEGHDKYDLLDYNADGGRRKRHDAQYIIDKTGIPALADVEVINIGPIDSTEISTNHWHILADICCVLADDPEIRGIVIGHGTASLEETAWILFLVLNLKIRIVITGSVRPLTGISSDATANLTAAFRVAAHPVLPNEPAGVLVVANDEIHSPRYVTKTHTLRLGTFNSPWLGPIGYVDGEDVNMVSRQASPASGQFHRRMLIGGLPRVDIVYSYVSADGTAIKAFVAAGAKGLVSAGFGPGLGTRQETLALEEAISEGVVVVQSSRLGAGKVVDSQCHRKLGIIAGNDLNPQKARILLSLCLSRGDDQKTIERVFGCV